MKSRKWLFAIPVIASATCAVSCGNKNTLTYEDIEDAIFGPHDLKEKTTPHPGCVTFVDCLKQASKEDRQKELLYSIYAPIFYLKAESALQPFDKAPLYDLWKDKTVVLSASISECSLEVRDNEVYADFIGYVKLTFQKEWEGFANNDFLQFTFVLDNEKITPDDSNWYFKYTLDTRFPQLCWGLVQVHKGENVTRLFHWDWLGYESGFEKFPLNWHNWVQEAA